MENSTNFTFADETAAQVYLIIKSTEKTAFVLGQELSELSQNIGKKIWHVQDFDRTPKFDGVHLRYKAPLTGGSRYLCEDGTFFGVVGPADSEKILEAYETARTDTTTQ